jgi:hypothetical protein
MYDHCTDLSHHLDRVIHQCDDQLWLRTFGPNATMIYVSPSIASGSDRLLKLFRRPIWQLPRWPGRPTPTARLYPPSEPTLAFETSV